jgi:hypothetical protein
MCSFSAAPFRILLSCIVASATNRVSKKAFNARTMDGVGGLENPVWMGEKKRMPGVLTETSVRRFAVL